MADPREPAPDVTPDQVRQVHKAIDDRLDRLEDRVRAKALRIEADVRGRRRHAPGSPA